MPTPEVINPALPAVAVVVQPVAGVAPHLANNNGQLNHTTVGNYCYSRECYVSSVVVAGLDAAADVGVGLGVIPGIQALQAGTAYWGLTTTAAGSVNVTLTPLVACMATSWIPVCLAGYLIHKYRHRNG